MIKHLKHIIIGWYRKLTGKNEQMAKHRLEICNQCPHQLWITTNVSICKLCGCELDAKSRVEDEICHDGRW